MHAARSAEPDTAPVEAEVEAKDKAPPPEKEKKLTESAKTDLFNLPPLMGTQFATGFNPHMMGDQQGGFTRRTITVTGVITTTTIVTNLDVSPPNNIIVTRTSTPTSRTFTILVPTPSSGSFKIAENDSPKPVDRVFFTWNYFSHIADPQGAPVASVNTNQQATFTSDFGTTAAVNVNTSIPGLPRAIANLHREVFGFEKTFLDGNASIEMRVPLLQQTSNIDSFGAKDVGDITILTKYAFLLDRDTGNVFSGGLAVTVPNGPSIPSIDGNLHSTLLQPWFGYLWNSDRFFLQAFHSVVVPTDPRDVTLMFNDVGINWWLYRGSQNRVLNFIVPTFETHVTTPLNHRDGNGPIFVPDLVVLTSGVHIGLFGNGTLSLGVAFPVSGPRAYNVESFLQLNWRF
jgi:hypothetical protein